MDKKGLSDIFVQMLIALVVISLSMVAFQGYKYVMDSACTSQKASFSIDVKEIDVALKPGSVKRVELDVPCGAERVYFVDSTKSELEQYLKSSPLMVNTLEDGVREDVFLTDGNTLKEAFGIGAVDIGYPHYLCMKPRGGEVSLFVEKVGGKVRLTQGCGVVDCAEIPEEVNDIKAREVIENFVNFSHTGACPTCPTNISLELQNYNESRDDVEIYRRFTFCADTGITKVEIIIKPKKSLEDFYLYEYIPKDCVESLQTYLVGEVEGDVSIKDDPLMMWHFDELKSETTVSYEITKDLSDECKKLFESIGVMRRVQHEAPVVDTTPETPVIDIPQEPTVSSPEPVQVEETPIDENILEPQPETATVPESTPEPEPVVEQPIPEPTPDPQPPVSEEQPEPIPIVEPLPPEPEPIPTEPEEPLEPIPIQEPIVPEPEPPQSLPCTSCDTCWDLLSFSICTVERCNSCTTNCYYVDNLIMPNECNTCPSTCDGYLNQERCVNDPCALSDCAWGGSNCYTQTIDCNDDSECGVSGLIDEPFCSGEESHQYFVTHTCTNPGTFSSVCSSTPGTVRLQDCAASPCEAYSPWSCQDATTRERSRRCYSKGCNELTGACNPTSQSQEFDIRGCASGETCSGGSCVPSMAAFEILPTPTTIQTNVICPNGVSGTKYFYNVVISETSDIGANFYQVIKVHSNIDTTETRDTSWITGKCGTTIIDNTHPCNMIDRWFCATSSGTLTETWLGIDFNGNPVSRTYSMSTSQW